MKKRASKEITVRMRIDVDGAPNCYGPDDRRALDFALNAHVGAKKAGKIVGYLTKNDDGRTPVVQGPRDPCPGFYISTTALVDRQNMRATDPRRYVNAAEINYTLLARTARAAGVKLGDFCVVHSLRTNFTVFAIVGDTGNGSGAEGSLALLQRLGYAVKDGKAGGEDEPKIVVRYFAGTNPEHRFFFSQTELETTARELNLDADFSEFHAGQPGTLVLVAAAAGAGPISPAVAVVPFAPLGKNKMPPLYPGHFIQLDSSDEASVRVVQRRLRALGYTQPGRGGAIIPLKVDGGYGTCTKNAVELFQTRHTTATGAPLEADGEVGSDTWGALFGGATIHRSSPPVGHELVAKVLQIAAAEIGTLEKPPGSNRGPRVQEYQRAVGIDPGEPWCVAFVFFCFAAAAHALGMANPIVTAKCRTGSVQDLWNRARAQPGRTLPQARALDDPAQVTPGMVFIISTGGGHGHTGIVTAVLGNELETIEGNTNDGGSREGIGVFRRRGRNIASINRGFIDFAKA